MSTESTAKKIRDHENRLLKERPIKRPKEYPSMASAIIKRWGRVHETKFPK